MRIIGGKFKGKKLNQVKLVTTRPLKDVVKESIFNVLAHSKDIFLEFGNSKVLDLYSGIGSFGIECISRGSNKVTFVEKNENAFSVIKKNLSTLQVGDKAELINDSVENYLLDNREKKFNIFFFDPPYSDKSFLKNLKLLRSKKIFLKDHIIIIHRESKISENFNEEMKVLKIKTYGRSKIFFGIFY